MKKESSEKERTKGLAKAYDISSEFVAWFMKGIKYNQKVENSNKIET